MTARQLKAAQDRLERAQKRAQAAQGNRDRVIRAARADGWSYSEIATALGDVSRARVAQIARQNPPTTEDT
jgi:hypothetical protein